MHRQIEEHQTLSNCIWKFLLYFLAGVVLTSVGAYFVLRSVKSSAVAAQENIGEDVNYEDVEKMYNFKIILLCQEKEVKLLHPES